MATKKRRLNITLSEDMEFAIKELAKRDNVPEATKAAELLKIAIEYEEDAIWDQIASERATDDAKYISHEEFWKDV